MPRTTIQVPRIGALAFILIASAQFGFLYGSAILFVTGGLTNVILGTIMTILATGVLTFLTKLFVLDRRILKTNRRLRLGSTQYQA